MSKKRKQRNHPLKSLKNFSPGVVSSFNQQNNIFEKQMINSSMPLRINSKSNFVTLDENLLSDLYINSPIVQRAIRQPVEDALRGGIEISCEELGDRVNDVLSYLEDNGIFDTIKYAFIWSRLYGGAGIFINVDDDESYENLEIENINKDNEIEFFDLNRWEIQKNRYLVTYNFLDTKETKEDDYYTLREVDTKIHKSRLIEITNKKAPRYLQGLFQGWGFSEVEKLKQALKSYDKSLNVLFELTDEAKLDVFHIEGLKDELEKPNGASQIMKMIYTNNYFKNYQNALIMDKNDDFEQKNINFTGVNTAGENARSSVVTASEMNRSKILGEHASNFSNDLASTEDYNAMVTGSVREPMKKVLRQIIKIVMKKLFNEIYDFEIEFKSLRILSSLDEEVIKEKKRNGIIEFLKFGILDLNEAKEIAKKESLI